MRRATTFLLLVVLPLLAACASTPGAAEAAKPVTEGDMWLWALGILLGVASFALAMGA